MRVQRIKANKSNRHGEHGEYRTCGPHAETPHCRDLKQYERVSWRFCECEQNVTDIKNKENIKRGEGAHTDTQHAATS